MPKCEYHSPKPTLLEESSIYTGLFHLVTRLIAKLSLSQLKSMILINNLVNLKMLPFNRQRSD